MYEPRPIADGAQEEGCRHLRSAHRARQVLLVCEHEQRKPTQHLVVEEVVELFPRVLEAIAVVGVDHKDECPCPGEVMTIERPDLRHDRETAMGAH
eukprot:4147635-Pleurochrysis_carterae.AAC.2